MTDLATGTVLVSENADARKYPASLTKLMTLFLLFEGIDEGRITPEQRLPVSKRAAMQPPTRLGLRSGASISVEDCIGALILRSANDVATVVAEGLEVTEERFAEKMTATARRLGMTQTVFQNASGLPDPNQFTTARDMTLLAEALITRFPQHYGHFGLRYCRVAGRTIATHNTFLQLYDGADGLKTGYTREAGYNLAASVGRNGRRLVGVVLGGSSRNDRNTKMARIMNDGFSQLQLPATNRTVLVASAKPRHPRLHRGRSHWRKSARMARKNSPARTTARSRRG